MYRSGALHTHNIWYTAYQISLYALFNGGQDMPKAAIKLQPLDANIVLKDKVYEALKAAISSMDIYSDEDPVRLDERQLAEDLGVSRTPIREAFSRLEQED